MNQQIIEAIKQLGKATFLEIYKITKIPKINLHRLLRTMTKRGEVIREWLVTGAYRYGHVGSMKRWNFVYSLPTVSTAK